MAETLRGFPFWELRFDRNGAPLDGSADRLVAEAPAAGISDLFVFSHGWNNDAVIARRLCDRFFGEVRRLADDHANAAIGVAGLIWPAMRWPDESPAEERVGGALALSVPQVGDDAVMDMLRAVYPEPEERRAVDELEDLLARQPDDRAALDRFHELLAVLAGGPDPFDAPEDAGEQALVSSDARDVFDASADLVPVDRLDGAAGFLNGFGRLWVGAKQALRQTTYWQMKKRAGIVGANGLASVVIRLAHAAPALRLHLVGHSFGARLVSYTLKGLSEEATRDSSPIKSLMLVQGAFSHFAFATALPHDPGRAGGLAAMQQRVAGPVVVTHSRFDLAVGNLYPWGSIAGRDDAAAAGDLLYRWGAMGHDGAQCSNAAEIELALAGQTYAFEPGQIYNLDSNRVISEGDAPAGAHSDIIHPELAWAALSAAALV